VSHCYYKLPPLVLFLLVAFVFFFFCWCFSWSDCPPTTVVSDRSNPQSECDNPKPLRFENPRPPRATKIQQRHDFAVAVAETIVIKNSVFAVIFGRAELLITFRDT
jgi:hypothetical protein